MTPRRILLTEAEMVRLNGKMRCRDREGKIRRKLQFLLNAVTLWLSAVAALLFPDMEIVSQQENSNALLEIIRIRAIYSNSPHAIIFHLSVEFEQHHH